MYAMENESADKRLLVIDDEENMRHMLSTLLRKRNYQVETASNGAEAIDLLVNRHYDYILCDIKMPRMDGMEFLKRAKRLIEATTVIMMSAYGNIDTAIEAMKLGAYDYISKPFKTDEVYMVLKKAEERERLKIENRNLKRQIQEIEGKFQFGNMVAKSKAMKDIFRLAEKVAQYDTTVLITGESGTGKELIAKGIHLCGKRSQFPMVPVNCGGIPENLLESELFGYKKGAFTGADKNKKGLFQEADRGTIFLDEIGELPSALQVKILRILQEQEVRPIGGSKARQIDVRVIAATSRDLEKDVLNKSFREDLFYRLNVLPIQLPSLRERIEDVPLLSDYFIGRLNKRLNKQVNGIAPSAMAVLLKHRWPGNVRELENAIERAMVLTDGDLLSPDAFSLQASMDMTPAHSYPASDDLSLKTARMHLEKEFIEKALAETGGNRTRAARLLEISHPSLLNKMKQYHIS
jgi:two-component system response regulator AtoC